MGTPEWELIGEGSHSPRSGWIEIAPTALNVMLIWSHSPRSGWIEIGAFGGGAVAEMSHSPRSGWIEMEVSNAGADSVSVPLPTEWVD